MHLHCLEFSTTAVATFVHFYLLSLICVLDLDFWREFPVVKMMPKLVMYLFFFLFHILLNGNKDEVTYNHFEATESLDVCCEVISPEFLSLGRGHTPLTERSMVFRFRVILTIGGAKRNFNCLGVFFNESTGVPLLPLIDPFLMSMLFICSLFFIFLFDRLETT